MQFILKMDLKNKLDSSTLWPKQVKCLLTTHLFHVQLWLAWRKLRRSWLEMPSGPLTLVMNSKKGRSGMERSQPEHYITLVGTLDPSIHPQPQLLLWFHLIYYSTRQASKMKEFIMHLLIIFQGIAVCGRLGYYFENQSILTVHVTYRVLKVFFFCLAFQKFKAYMSILIIHVENNQPSWLHFQGTPHFVRLRNI